LNRSDGPGSCHLGSVQLRPGGGEGGVTISHSTTPIAK
jgi:hypothetical protein